MSALSELLSEKLEPCCYTLALHEGVVKHRAELQQLSEG